MIKVFYDGCIIRPSHFHTDTPRQPEPVQEYFYLHDDDIKRLNNFGEVKLRSVIGERLDEYAMLIWEEGDDLPLVQYTATFADRFGNDDTFTITKDKIQDMYENGNALKLIFDDDEEPQTNPEQPINPSTDDLEQNNSLPTNEKPENKGKGFQSIQQKRDEDFELWMSIVNPPLKKMKKEEIHKVLIARNSTLWTSGFTDWWKQQTIYKAPKGRKKITIR